MSQLQKNTLFYGDNLLILREYIADESIDLIYLDPPFNSNRTYNVLFKDESGKESQAQIAAFDDTWHWNQATEQTYQALVTSGSPQVASMISALHESIGTNQMMAYLVMMAARLVELHRILKATGSLYLHCDTTASHYLKVVLDAIFGVRMFRNELIWQRTRVAKRQSGFFGKVHDVILFYTKSEQVVFNEQFLPYNESYIKSHYNQIETETGHHYGLWDLTQAGQGPARTFGDKVLNPPAGKHWIYSQENIDKLMGEGRIVFTKTGMPRLKRYLEAGKGEYIQDIWIDIFDVNAVAKERLGYPTQKPLALLERIINASSNPDDIVLDPFCGCGTTIAAAQKLGRRWVGIDITHLSIALQKYRLKDMFGVVEKKDYMVIGEPQDLPAAQQLAQDDRYQFQWWALSLVKARPIGDTDAKQGKKGSDKGIDGVITFIDEASGKGKRVLVQVKSGHVKSGDIRDLRGTIDREGAAMAVFITLETPSRDMMAEAASVGFYHSPGWNQDYPKLQILTIADLLNGVEVKMPPTSVTFKQAERVKPSANQQSLF